MTALKSRAAVKALADLLETTSGLPDVTFNDVGLEGFDDSGTAGVKWKLAVADSDIGVYDTALGRPMTWELSVGATIVFMVEGVAGSERDTVFDAVFAALAGALYPPDGGGQPVPLTIAGKFDDLQIDGPVKRYPVHETGRMPIEVCEIGVNLLVSAPTPLG